MWIIIASSTIYFCSLIFFLFGLKKTKVSNKNKINDIDVSIILCVRNGEKSLPNILNDFSNQKYNGNLEFIIVDDESSDKTKEIISEFVEKDSRFKYIHSNTGSINLNHKKKALDAGIKKSNYDWLLFTDVDCRVNENWVSGMSNNYLNNDYVVGFSMTNPGNSIVSKFQSIDFNMLMFSACAATTAGYPLASSGQNQSYKKSVFKQVDGFNKIENLLQGDDSIFLQICNKIKKLKITFSTNSSSFVVAKTHHSLKDFFLQRIRWSGDANLMWKYNSIFFLIIISTFLTNLLSIYLIIDFLLSQTFLLFTVSIITIKFILEFLIYFYGCLKFEFKIQYLSFIFWFFSQMPYVVLMGIFSFFRDKFNWKSRAI